MPIPSYEACMLPLLKLLSSGVERSMEEIRGELAAQFALTDGDLSTLLPSGQQTVFHSRVGWARTYLKKAGLVDSPKRGRVAITFRGVTALAESPTVIDDGYLSRFEEFVAFKGSRPKGLATKPCEQSLVAEAAIPSPVLSPEEALQHSYQSLMDDVAAELLSRVKQCSPAFFERLVVQLLVQMGYGGTEKDAAQAVGRSGDGGIDGVIREDALGLDFVYVQAKRWDSTVGSPQIHQFVGALTGRGARKGVFLTTATFSKEARQYAAAMASPRVVLVDGEQLANLMLRYGVGVSTAQTYALKKVDTDFFVED